MGRRAGPEEYYVGDHRAIGLVVQRGEKAVSEEFGVWEARSALPKLALPKRDAGHECG